MRHSIHAEGFGVRLRPVTMQDAAFIVWLRNLDYVKGKIGDSAADVASQQAWLKAYFERDGDYYFIIETAGGIAVGTHSLYDIVEGRAELGRWVIRPGVQAAVPSHMVAFDIAFNRLGLRALRNATVSTNLPVISISRRFGFEAVGLEHGSRQIGGKSVDMMCFVLTAEKWALTRPALVPKAQLAERLVLEWEKAQRQDPPTIATGNTAILSL
jgi:RimJ/RimL family protein N-acetyltransferase